MDIRYGASSDEAIAKLQIRSNAELRKVLPQLMSDFNRMHRHHLTFTLGCLVLIIAVSLTTLIVFDDSFPIDHVFSYWTFHLGVSLLLPLVGIWMLNKYVVKPYWTWQKQFRIWLDALDHVTFKRFGNP